MTEAAGNEGERTIKERLAALEERLHQVDDAVVVRALAVMDVAEELHRQSNERIDQLTATVDRLAALVIQSIENANADRAIIRDNQTEIRRIWEYLLRQQPNGHGDNPS